MKSIYIILLVILASCVKDDTASISRHVINTQIQNSFSEQPNDALFLPSGDILTVATSTENMGLKCLVLSSEDGTLLQSHSILNQSNIFSRDLLAVSNSYYIVSDFEISSVQRNLKCIHLNMDLTVSSEFNIPSNHHEVGVKIIKQNQSNNLVLLANRKNKDTETWGFVLYEFNGSSIVGEHDFPHTILQSGSDLIPKQNGSGYYVFAHVIENPMNSTDFVLYELNNAFEVVQVKYFGGGEYEEARRILEDENGHVYLFGHSASKDILHEMYLIKLNQSLSKIYEMHYGSVYHDGGQTLCFDGGNKITLVGRSDAPNNTDENIYVVKINTDGQVLDEYYLGDSTSNRADIVLNKNGIDYIIGNTTIDQNFTKNIEYFQVSY